MAGLSYQIPDAGRRKRILRIPESHTLHLCPNACGRRQGIRALRNGEADRVSFLCFSQADVASGDYEAQVAEAVGQLLDTLLPVPRVVSLYLNCIDDFLGTDEDGLLRGLSAAFPQVKFTLSHINPIARDMGASPAAGIQARLYGLLEPPAPGARDAGVTLLGAFEPPDAAGELLAVLRALGAGPVRQLLACETFAEYERLAISGLALSLSHLGDGPAALFEQRLHMPTMVWHATYALDEVDARYAALARALAPAVAAAGAPAGGPAAADALLAAARRRAEAAVREARAAVGSLPVAVDSAASMMPFTLACDLIGYGFDVVAVFALHTKGNDDAAEARLAREHPGVAIVREGSVEAIRGFGLPQECLAIGQDAAFMLHAAHAVDVYHDEGLFGYHGIERLMRAMADAVRPGAGDEAAHGGPADAVEAPDAAGVAVQPGTAGAAAAEGGGA